MNQSTDNIKEADEIWESFILEKFPNASKEAITEAKLAGSIQWMFGEKTVMSEIFDKYIMMKRLRGL